MFQCGWRNEHTDWTKCFQDWIIVHTLSSVVIYLVITAIIFVICLVHYADSSSQQWLISLVRTIVHMVVGVFITWTCWYCIVKQKGCCGSIGYLLWGLGMFVWNFAPMAIPLGYMISNGDSSWSSLVEFCTNYEPIDIILVALVALLYLLQLVPWGYMILALFKLFQQGSARGPLLQT